MQGPAHHVSPIKNWKQLVVVVVLAFLVPIAVIILLSQYVTDVSAPATMNDGAEHGSSRSARLLIEPAGGAKSAEVASATTGARRPPPQRPQQPRRARCTGDLQPRSQRRRPRPLLPRSRTARRSTTRHVSACHGTGVAGAPKFGDKAAWAPRIKLGIDALHASAHQRQGRDARQGRQCVVAAMRT